LWIYTFSVSFSSTRNLFSQTSISSGYFGIFLNYGKKNKLFSLSLSLSPSLSVSNGQK
jgi:hypothetical protein